MSRQFRSVIVVTLFMAAGQVVALLTQITRAAYFGAGPEMDGFLAAATLPQYLTMLFQGAILSVLVPLFAERLSRHSREDAWEMINSLFSLSLFFLLALSFLGICFARPLLAFSTPGLSVSVMDSAVSSARVVWPTVGLIGVVTIYSCVLRVEERFGWQSLVPVLGSTAMWFFILFFGRKVGIESMAWGLTISSILQSAIFISLYRRRFRFHLNLGHPGLRDFMRLLLPLLLSGIVVKSTPLVERHLASEMAAGSISHLAYAFTLITGLSTMISTGISTVIFPRLAMAAAERDMAALRRRVGTGLRFLWLAVAPCAVLMATLSLPFATLLFQRGKFSQGDTLEVAGLLRWYLLGLPGICFGTVTGQSLYALKRVRLLMFVGVLESVAYLGYTVLLARTFGAPGVVMGYVIYFSISICWALVAIDRIVGGLQFRELVGSFSTTALASLLAGGAAFGGLHMVRGPALQLAVGGTAGLIVFVGSLVVLGSSEWREVTNLALGRWRIEETPGS